MKHEQTDTGCTCGWGPTRGRGEPIVHSPRMMDLLFAGHLNSMTNPEPPPADDE